MTAGASGNGSGALDDRDPLGLAADAPLLRAYLDCLDRHDASARPFHTPGHKGSTALTGMVVAGDHPLAGGLDTIKMRHGWLDEAEHRAAALYGADVCRFSAGGSTHCNQALALSVGVPGETVPFAAAAGRVSAELIALYPPGVPVLAPGELVTEQALGVLSEAAADGVRIAYAADPALATLEVLA